MPMISGGLPFALRKLLGCLGRNEVEGVQDSGFGVCLVPGWLVQLFEYTVNPKPYKIVPCTRQVFKQAWSH